MAKIKINSKISSNNSKALLTSCNGIKKDNLITYKDSSAFINILLSKDSVFIKRENEDFELKLTFKEKQKCPGVCFMKSLNLNLDVMVNTKKLQVNDNNLFIEYELYVKDELSDVFVFKVEWSDFHES